MGQSTNAIIFYGVVADEEAYNWWLPIDVEEGPDDFETAVEAWAAEAGQTPQEFCDVGADDHGMEGWRVPYLYAWSTHARRGHPVEFDPNVLAGLINRTEADAALAKIAERTPRVAWSKPGWYLVSWWG